MAVKEPVTCRQAISATWPQNLQEGAITVLTHENRSENPEAVGAPNSDGSRDYGCFQINDYWHKAFFAESDWKDPVANASYGYKIWQGRQAKTGNGWMAWYAVKRILW